MEVRWRFRAMAPGEMNFDPMERELFGNEGINTRLARESIQNSLDAVADKSRRNPIRMRFSLAGIHSPLPAERAAPYLSGLIEHLGHINPEHLDDDIAERVLNNNLAAGGVPFLVIEDASTQGLNGDWWQFNDSDQQTGNQNHFFWFFRNIGRSGKGDSDNGSWGLGKWVFPDVSRVSAYIAVTRRSLDDKTLLMGQSILTKHTIGDERYEPYGFLGIAGDNGLQLPLVMSDPNQRTFVERCIADFGLRLRGEPGLSVIIPFPRINAEDEENISASGLLVAIVRNYFYPIIDGRLEITVDEGDGSPPVDLTTNTIDNVIKNLDLQDAGELSEQSYAKLFEMCRECITIPDAAYTTLAELPSNDPTDADYATVVGLRDRYNSGELLAFRIGGYAQRKKEARKPTEFRLYLQRDDLLPHGHDYYVRGTLSISDMDHIRRYRSWALLRVDERDPLAAMLRDSEPAAHTSWRPQTRRVHDRWVAPRRRIDDVRHAPATMLSILETPQEGLQKDAFSDIFFWDGDETAPPDRGRARERSLIYNRKRIDPLLRRRREFAVSRINSGFRVTLADGVEEPPSRAQLQVGYEVPRGNPLKNYHPEDFRLHGRGETLTIHFGGCQVRPGREGNAVFLEIDNPDEFEFTVTGFDPLRDLHVRVEAVADNAEGDDAGTQV